MYKGCHEVGMPHYDFEKWMEQYDAQKVDVRTLTT